MKLLNIEKSISNRRTLVSVIGVILVVGFLANIMIGYQVSKESLRAALIDNELPLTSNNIYSEIQHDLLQPVFTSSLMANNTFVIDWLVEGEKGVEKITRYLDKIRAKYGVFSSFLVSEKTKNYYHFTGVAQVVSEKDPADIWYYRFKNRPGTHEVNVDYNAEQNNSLTIFINRKVFDYDGNYLGAIGVGLNFDTLNKMVDRYKEIFGRHIYFVDAKGTVMLRSSDPGIVADNIHSALGVSAVAEKILASDNGSFEYERNGEMILLHFRKIPDLKWYVLVEQNESSILKGIQKSLKTNLIIGFIVITLTLLIITYTINAFHARLENMATTDSLTGLGNRNQLDFALSQAIGFHVRDHKPVSLIMIDVDHFKKINDTFGHLEGDRVLKDMATVIRKELRATDVVCRWGGEEFIILAHDCDMDSTMLLAEKIRAAVESAPLLDFKDDSSLTISAGVAELTDADTGDTLLSRADGALYVAKRAGRNCIRKG